MEITCNRTTVALEPYTACEARTFQRGQRVIVKGLVRKAEMSDIEVDGWDGYLVVQLNPDGADFAVKADCFTGGNAALKTLKEAEYDRKLRLFIAEARRMGRSLIEIECDIHALAKRDGNASAVLRF